MRGSYKIPCSLFRLYLGNSYHQIKSEAMIRFLYTENYTTEALCICNVFTYVTLHIISDQEERRCSLRKGHTWYIRLMFCINDLDIAHLPPTWITTQGSNSAICLCDSKLTCTACQPPNNQWMTFLRELVSKRLYVSLVCITLATQLESYNKMTIFRKLGQLFLTTGWHPFIINSSCHFVCTKIMFNVYSS